MKSEAFLRILGQIDDDLILEAADASARRAPAWIRPLFRPNFPTWESSSKKIRIMTRCGSLCATDRLIFSEEQGNRPG